MGSGRNVSKGYVLCFLNRVVSKTATTGAGDEEFCDFALVTALLFEYVGQSLWACLKLKKPSFHDVSVLL